MSVPRAIIATVIVCVAIVRPALAIEDWADKQLPVQGGLVIWIDAGVQPAAWRAHGKPDLHDGSAVDACYDGSGNGLHLTQRMRDAQPRYTVLGDRGVLRFDGKDDFVGLTLQNRSLDAFTLFVVAAPRSNAGLFRAFIAANETGKNDYLTGYTVDMDAGASDRFNQLNAEGKGFQGAVNLMHTAHPFGEFHVLEVTSMVGPGGVKLFVDGAPAGQRDHGAGTLHMDDMSVGARFYSNTPEPPAVSGFLDGNVAAVLVYDRVLDEGQRRSVEDYLQVKFAGLHNVPASRPLRAVTNPPPVQMLRPGFMVKELPVDLTNVNNVRYRADGKLVAVAYNGKIYLLLF